MSPTPGRRLFGPAVTIAYFPACRAALPPERYNFKRLFYEAIEGGDATTAGAGQRRGGDIESQHVREGTRGGVTVDMRRFCHHSFFLD